jgi:hypothetical protein
MCVCMCESSQALPLLWQELVSNTLEWICNTVLTVDTNVCMRGGQVSDKKKTGFALKAFKDRGVDLAGLHSIYTPHL